MLKLRAIVAPLFVTLSLLSLQAIAENQHLPRHATVCNYIAEHHEQNAVFYIDGHPFDDGNYRHSIVGNKWRWYVTATNPRTNNSFTCACYNVGDGNQCSPTNS